MNAGDGVVVVTAIYGGRDRLKRPAVLAPDVDYVCFTDSPFLGRIRSAGWEIRRVPGDDPDPMRSAKLFKIPIHRHFPTHRYSIWVDASRRVNVDPRPFLERHLASADLAVFSHPDRDSVFEEAALCKEWGKDDPEVIDRQMARYRREGFPDTRLGTCTVILRRHTEKVRRFDETWWDEVRRFSRRDQLSFDYAAWKESLDYAVIPGSIWETELFPYHGHRGEGPGIFVNAWRALRRRLLPRGPGEA